jgi:hypothetical protein
LDEFGRRHRRALIEVQLPCQYPESPQTRQFGE